MDISASPSDHHDLTPRIDPSSVFRSVPGSDASSTLSPAHAALREFQERFAAESRNLSLADPRMKDLINTYSALLHLSGIERINETLEKAMEYEKLALLKELNKAKSNMERTLSRFSREQAERDREDRRRQREKAQQARAHRLAEDAQIRHDRKLVLAQLALTKEQRADARQARAKANREYKATYSKKPVEPAETDEPDATDKSAVTANTSESSGPATGPSAPQ